MVSTGSLRSIVTRTCRLFTVVSLTASISLWVFAGGKAEPSKQVTDHMMSTPLRTATMPWTESKYLITGSICASVQNLIGISLAMNKLTLKDSIKLIRLIVLVDSWSKRQFVHRQGN